MRPTGLLDPEIEVRPARTQVDDLLGEIRKDRIRPLFARELAFGLLSGATIGLIVFLLIIGLGALGRAADIGLFSGFDWRLGLVAAMAMQTGDSGEGAVFL